MTNGSGHEKKTDKSNKDTSRSKKGTSKDVNQKGNSQKE
jgi:hypothetical protein